MAEKPDMLTRASDEIELIMRDYVDDWTAMHITTRIIPILGKLARDVMADIKVSVEEIIDETKSRAD